MSQTVCYSGSFMLKDFVWGGDGGIIPYFKNNFKEK